MGSSIMKGLGLDHYQRSAQLQPAMLSVAPLTATALLWAPKASALIGTLVSATVTLGLLNLLMQFGRARGRRVQETMVARLGALPSALALRHADPHVPAELKKRYHAALRKNGFAIPSEAQEAVDPDAALAIYRAASAWLPDQTRDTKKFELLHVENRSYGFRRNLLGLKPFGVAILLAALAINGALGWHFSQDSDRLLVAVVFELAMLLALIAWVFVIRAAFVEDASWAYATRQLAASESLPSRRSPARPAAKMAPPA
jgi:hypothetical protein